MALLGAFVAGLGAGILIGTAVGYTLGKKAGEKKETEVKEGETTRKLGKAA